MNHVQFSTSSIWWRHIVNVDANKWNKFRVVVGFDEDMHSAECRLVLPNKRNKRPAELETTETFYSRNIATIILAASMRYTLQRLFFVSNQIDILSPTGPSSKAACRKRWAAGSCANDAAAILTIGVVQWNCTRDEYYHAGSLPRPIASNANYVQLNPLVTNCLYCPVASSPVWLTRLA